MTKTNLEGEWGTTIAYSRLCIVLDEMDSHLKEMLKATKLITRGEVPSADLVKQIEANAEKVEAAMRFHRATKEWALQAQEPANQ